MDEQVNKTNISTESESIQANRVANTTAESETDEETKESIDTSKDEPAKPSKKAPRENKVKNFFASYSKKTKILMGCMLVGFCVCVGLIVGICVQSEMPHQISDQVDLAGRTTADLKLFEFQLENENYQIPMPFSAMEEKGWILNQDPLLYAGETRALAAEKGNLTIYLNICNQSGEPANASTGQIVQITVKAGKTEEETPVFFGVDGLHMRMSYDQIEKLLGKCDVAEKINGVSYYTYYYGETAAIKVAIDPTTGLSKITLNRVN